MLQAAAVAFATVFVAELGDKSQLLALSLAARYRRRVLLPAVLTASAATVGLSVVAGSLVGRVVPTTAVTAASGVLFLVFAVLTLRGDEDEETTVAGGRSGFLAAVTALSLAELGDKTMVASFALAASTSAAGVWLGGTLGMAGAGAIAVLLGAAVWRRLRPRTVRLASAALFATVGVALLVQTLVG